MSENENGNVYYHGTSAYSAKRIMTGGFVPAAWQPFSQSASDWTSDSRMVYFSSVFGDAEAIALWRDGLTGRDREHYRFVSRLRGQPVPAFPVRHSAPVVITVKFLAPVHLELDPHFSQENKKNWLHEGRIARDEFEILDIKRIPSQREREKRANRVPIMKTS